MPKCLLLILAFLLWIGAASAMISPEEITGISDELADQIITGKALIIDIRAGEWSHAIANGIKQRLLEKGADIRELSLTSHSPAFFEDEPDSLGIENYELGSLQLAEAILVQVDMELRWHTVMRKSFLSYSSQRKPMYVFNIKQISLPSKSLLKVGSVSRELDSNASSQSSNISIKWYEPLLVTVSLASIIYLLWTTE